MRESQEGLRFRQGWRLQAAWAGSLWGWLGSGGPHPIRLCPSPIQYLTSPVLIHLLQSRLAEDDCVRKVSLACALLLGDGATLLLGAARDMCITADVARREK